ncbi:hypothetical protein BDV11DRAFT_85890 [Aspergillus similis]
MVARLYACCLPSGLLVGQPGFTPRSRHRSTCNCAPMMVASAGTARTWQSEGGQPDTVHAAHCWGNVMTQYKRMEGYPVISTMTAFVHLLISSCDSF